MMKWLWHLHREWKARAKMAQEDAERSRRELEQARRQVIKPLAEWRKQNHFAQLIKDSLLTGDRQ